MRAKQQRLQAPHGKAREAFFVMGCLMERDLEKPRRTKMKRLLTSESVTEGHPDKLCDLLAASILDECLKGDPDCLLYTSNTYECLKRKQEER